MALLEILKHPDSRLRTKAKSVEVIDATTAQITNDMLETMYSAKGIGLAATQVNIHQRIIVIDVSKEHNQPIIFINPTIEEKDGTQVYEEGCLSVPGYTEEVTRAATLKVSFLDLNNQLQTLTCDGLLAVCLQHEMDHLEGKLFVDYLSDLKQEIVMKKMLKQQKRSQS
jgi:peptide deformylase